MSRLTGRTLTRRQGEVLTLLAAVSAPVTGKALAVAQDCGPGMLGRRLQALRRRGLVTWEPGRAGTLRLVRPYAVSPDGTVTPLVEVPVRRVTPRPDEAADRAFRFLCCGRLRPAHHPRCPERADIEDHRRQEDGPR